MNKHYNFEHFLKSLEQLDISLTEHQMNQFMQYYEILIEWNSFMNLTAITDFDEVVNKHFVDSLTLVYVEDLSQQLNILDLGTGAGFPGIPLKIVFPNLNITLLDSLNKRITFLDHVIEQLGLDNIHTLHGRAEDYAKNQLYREQFDVVVSRAVANLSTLCEYCIPYCKIHGLFVSYKSDKITTESEFAQDVIQLLGSSFEKQVEFNLPHSDVYRNLFCIRKTSNTPIKYPRKAGLPAKKPL